MIVTFVSECDKKAINKTRRVLDAFANRLGSRTWQTVITNEGLQAVKKLLRATASKNTAVACHWIRSRGRSELVWIVGNRNKFNKQGHVPVNTTEEEITQFENSFHNTEVIAILSSIAGLFHDFGKSNELFQQKLLPAYNGKRYEPYRHEWISLRFFQAFVGDKNDLEWLKTLANVTKQNDIEILAKLIKDAPVNVNYSNPLKKMPPLAKLVGWLIISHHRLPVYPVKKNNNPPNYENINEWLDHYFDPLWNSPSSFDEWEQNVRDKNWEFPSGTPIVSAIWQNAASEVAEKALKCQQLFKSAWFDHRFTAHMSRLALMLSDHYYSSETATPRWQDRSYDCIANTDDNNNPKQKLDEHNIGVCRNAYKLAMKLPELRGNLPSLGINKRLERNKSKEKRFKWQDKAYNLAQELRECSGKHGFFGINMASTGLGKTLANARIMYALSDENECRFCVALGLRTLTLQTGNKLAEDMELTVDEYAVLIGSQAVKALYDYNNKNGEQKNNSYHGSESTEELFPKDTHIQYSRIPDNEILTNWLAKSPKLQRLVDAPLLVCTIDHLIPATEGTRGGKQIAPMLRMLTSDIVLDEPDDFGLDDLPALCRCVNWAGVLGCRVLLSTATMPPAIAFTLFEAYKSGWKDFSTVNGNAGVTNHVCCAWFDEFNTASIIADSLQIFRSNHDSFVKNRVINLNKTTIVLRKANLLKMDCECAENAIPSIASTIHAGMCQLHKNNNQVKDGKCVSIGLVRMANINPLVAVSKQLLKISAPENTRFYFCVYHSQFPLAIRSFIENKLDSALARHDPGAIWKQTEIFKAVENSNEQHHIFIVLATAVSEVGRDHDYDWAIAEPSSMRSLIQLAGRIQRHRRIEPQRENLFILSKNYKTLKGDFPAFSRPGFESKTMSLISHDLYDILKSEQYEKISSVPRIQFSVRSKGEDQQGYSNLVQLEHYALFKKLLGYNAEKDNAMQWWKHEISWCGELQRRQPFRKSLPEEQYCLFLADENSEPVWKIKNDNVHPHEYMSIGNINRINKFDISARNQFWLQISPKTIYIALNSKMDLTIEKTSKIFGELRLRATKEQVIDWLYHPALGVHQQIEEG